MKLSGSLLLAAALASVTAIGPASGIAIAADNQITILYDAFGKDAAMRKDWGFSALVEVAGKRIMFDTGDDRDIFAANVKAKGVDLTNLDFVVLSHRHSDHMAGLSHVLSVNPKVKMTHGRADYLDYVLPKKTATVRSLRFKEKWQPDAVGRHDFNLEIDVGSYHGRQPRWRSRHARGHGFDAGILEREREPIMLNTRAAWAVAPNSQQSASCDGRYYLVAVVYKVNS
jgi:glyoxylase-like metal-dependent hydrolase (beta-lactamase superfamily II)